MLEDRDVPNRNSLHLAGQDQVRQVRFPDHCSPAMVNKLRLSRDVEDRQERI